MTESPGVLGIASPAQAAALASPVRLRIIRLTYAQALTNREIAQRLGKDPATVLHHVRKLVDAGFLEALPARRGNRGAREIPYRSTGISWRLDLPAGVVDQAMLEAFLSEVAEVGEKRLDQTRFVCRVDEVGKRELQRRLRELFDEFTERPRATEGELLAVYCALYPAE